MRRPLLWLLLWLGATSAFAPLRAPSRALSPAAPRATVSEPQVLQEEVDRVVQIAPNAMAHLRDMKSKLSKEVLHVRMGVRSGGCSGMSYVMDLMDPADLTEDDHIEEWDGEGIRCAIDPKSLLYLFGLVLDYSDELIGGGFSFSNPNADTTCGCGKSFSV